VHDVVVGAIELALERALERLDLGAQVRFVRRYAQHAHRALALDIGLLALAHHEQIDAVQRRERPDHVPQLDTRAAWTRHRAEPGEQHAGHSSIVGQLAGARKG
jgi:formate-dependent phosphoribosylglycinamide formyltransferase (GAR transformylase)